MNEKICNKIINKDLKNDEVTRYSIYNSLIEIESNGINLPHYYIILLDVVASSRSFKLLIDVFVLFFVKLKLVLSSRSISMSFLYIYSIYIYEFG